MAPEIPGYNLKAVYDTETACTLIALANVFIVGNDATGVGFIDDVLLPATVIAGKACALEQAIELGVTDFAGACESDNWEWAIYEAEWWNPVPARTVALPICS